MKLIRQRIDKFLGIKNTNQSGKWPWKGSSTYFYQADNVEINNDGDMLTKREGYYLLKSGSYSNLWSNEKVSLIVKDGNLYSLDLNTSTLSEKFITFVGYSPVTYVEIGTYIFCINKSTFIRLDINGNLISIPSVTKEFKQVMPGGELAEWYKGRLYISYGNLLYFSDAGTPWQYDLRKNIFQFEEDISMIVAVNDGLFISSDKTYFLSGTSPDKMERKEVVEYKAIRGTSRKIRDIQVGVNKLDEGILWVSEKGICVGGQGGFFDNLTVSNYVMPEITEGSSAMRDYGEKYQYISIMK